MARQLEIDRLCRYFIAQEASDMHLNVGKPPCLSIDDLLVPIKEPILDGAAIMKLMAGVIKDKKLDEFSTTGNADFAFGFEQARFRVNICRAGGEPKVTIRRLPHRLLTMEEIAPPPAFIEAFHRPRGLILVTGVTGSGKTTTMASAVNARTMEGNVHVVMIEDPTEYILPHNKGLVTAREVGTDVLSFSDGVIQSLRQKPNIIVVGEMRDLETIRAALTAAETGHIVFGTLHTQSAPQTINRIIDVFPGNEKEEIRAKLSSTLIAVLCQQLVRRKGGKGRVPAFEFLKMNSAVQHKIRTGETHAIGSMMQTGARDGMQTLDDHLYRLAVTEVIAPENAIYFANDPNTLKDRLRKRTSDEE